MQRSLWIAASLTTFLAVGSAPAQEKKDDDAKEKAMAIAAVGKAKISLKEAITAAQKKLPAGKPVEADISVEGDKLTYTIELHADGKQMAVDVDAITGLAAEPEEEDDDDAEEDDDDAEVAALKAPTSLLKALEIGQAKSPEGKAFYVGVTLEEGKLTYEVDLVAGDKVVSVEVNAANGEIVAVEEE